MTSLSVVVWKMEPLALQLPAERVGVGEVSVMGQGHAALVVVHQDGLDVALVVAAGGAVAHVAHGDVPPSQGRQGAPGGNTSLTRPTSR